MTTDLRVPILTFILTLGVIGITACSNTPESNPTVEELRALTLKIEQQSAGILAEIKQMREKEEARATAAARDSVTADTFRAKHFETHFSVANASKLDAASLQKLRLELARIASQLPDDIDDQCEQEIDATISLADGAIVIAESEQTAEDPTAETEAIESAVDRIDGELERQTAGDTKRPFESELSAQSARLREMRSKLAALLVTRALSEADAVSKLKPAPQNLAQDVVERIKAINDLLERCRRYASGDDMNRIEASLSVVRRTSLLLTFFGRLQAIKDVRTKVGAITSRNLRLQALSQIQYSASGLVIDWHGAADELRVSPGYRELGDAINKESAEINGATQLLRNEIANAASRRYQAWALTNAKEFTEKWAYDVVLESLRSDIYGFQQAEKPFTWVVMSRYPALRKKFNDLNFGGVKIGLDPTKPVVLSVQEQVTVYNEAIGTIRGLNAKADRLAYSVTCEAMLELLTPIRFELLDNPVAQYCRAHYEESLQRLRDYDSPEHFEYITRSIDVQKRSLDELSE